MSDHGTAEEIEAEELEKIEFENGDPDERTPDSEIEELLGEEPEDFDEPECETECTGARIELAREKVNDKWIYHWMLYANNGKMVATNPEPFSRLNDMKKTIASIKETIVDAQFVRLY